VHVIAAGAAKRDAGRSFWKRKAMHILAIIAWFILEFTRFKKTRRLVGTIAVLLSLYAFHCMLQTAMYRGQGDMRIRYCMHQLSESIRAGETNRVLSALQDVHDNILDNPDPAVTFMKMEKKYYPVILVDGEWQDAYEGTNKTNGR
jgi:hypothetical protein